MTPLLDPTLLGCCQHALEEIRDEFTRRYPGARCIVHSQLHCDKFQFSISHLYSTAHWDNTCHIGYGATPEACFASLDEQLGPPMSEAERLRFKAAKYIEDAKELEARMLAEETAPSTTLPVSSPACQ